MEKRDTDMGWDMQPGMPGIVEDHYIATLRENGNNLESRGSALEEEKEKLDG